jgi:hypothetical protein
MAIGEREQPGSWIVEKATAHFAIGVRYSNHWVGLGTEAAVFLCPLARMGNYSNWLDNTGQKFSALLSKVRGTV